MKQLLMTLMLAAVGLLSWLCRSTPAQVDSKPATGFAATRAVMQLFETRCLQCHDGKKSRGGLDLSARAKLLRGGESGPAIVPGDSKKSLLLKLVRHEQEPEMPRQGKKLSDAQVALLAAWIDAEAPYDR